MARYIDAELLEKDLRKLMDNTEFRTGIMVDAFEIIRKQTITPKAEWGDEIGDCHSTGKYRVCSRCGGDVFIPYFSKQALEKIDFDFCPNCGADMKEE